MAIELVQPVKRVEHYLYALCVMDYNNLPIPRSRLEFFVHALITGVLPEFEPETREEVYMTAIITGDYANLPLPKSRADQILYKICLGETEIRDIELETRYEILLAYIAEHGGMSLETLLVECVNAFNEIPNTVEMPIISGEIKGDTLVNEAVINEIEADNYYGCYFNTANNSVGTRTGLAVGLNVTDDGNDQTFTSDFDNVYPWSDIRVCNLAEDGTVNAYEGDANFTRDGSNGYVMVEIPKFYQNRFQDDTGVEYRISRHKLFGFWLNPCFIDSATGTELDKVYIGAYKASGSKTKLECKSGVYPLINITMTEARTAAKAIGTGWQLEDVCIRSLLEYLIFIEYANLDTQAAISRGQNSFSTQKVTIAEENVTRFIVSNSSAAQYVVGQTVWNGTNREVLSKEAYDDSNTAINVSGDAFTTTVDQSIDMRAWMCGKTDTMTKYTGSIVSRTDNKHPFKYRGIENLWGDIWEFIDGISIQANKPYVCIDPSKYVDNATEGTAGYSYVGYDTCTSNGTIKRMGLNLNYPYVALPISVSGKYSNYSDYYYQNNSTNRICLAGGGWRYGSGAGLSYWSCDFACTSRWASFGGRLAYKTPVTSL